MTTPTITLAELRDLDWQYAWTEVQEHEIGHQGDPHEQGFVIEPASGSRANGMIRYEATYQGHTIQLDLGWEASTGCDTYADLYDWDVRLEQMGPDPYELHGAHVVLGDEFAHMSYEDPEDEADGEELYEVVTTIAGRLDWEDHAHNHLPAEPEPEDIDTDEEADMETYTLERDNDRDVRFTGEKLGEWSSRRNALETPGQQGADNRWTEIAMYRTAGGKWVAHEIGVSQWQGERTRYTVHIADTDEDLIQALGTGRLAKAVYEDLGIDAAEEIE